MIFVLCSNHKVRKCHLAILKVKAVNVYVNALYTMKNAIQIEEAKMQVKDQSDVTSGTGSGLMRRNLRERGIFTNSHSRLPRRKLLVTSKDSRIQNTSRLDTDTIQESRKCRVQINPNVWVKGFKSIYVMSSKKRGLELLQQF